VSDSTKQQSEAADHGEYVWRFKLDGGQMDRVHENPLTEMLRRQLKALMGVVVLTDAAGNELRPTGFKLMNQLDATPFAIYAEPGNGHE